MTLTDSQVDRLGERIRTALSDEDRTLLLAFRASFLPAFHDVMRMISDELHIDPAGRPEKTPESIVAKLRRSRTRLSRMQDIAGCRIVVDNRGARDHVVSRVAGLFPEARVRPTDPGRSHGYRAVHAVVPARGRHVEVQVRTALQHLWAMSVERLVDVYDVDFKHGADMVRGGESVLDRLKAASDVLENIERTGDRDQMTGMTADEPLQRRVRQFASVMGKFGILAR